MKKILVTGCSSGVGRAAVLRLIERNYKVIAAVRQRCDALELMTAVGRDIDYVLLDVTDEISVNTAIQSLQSSGRAPDVLINNASVPCLGAMEELCTAQLQTAIEVNVLGVLRLFQAVVPSMRKRRCGQIINISSSLGAAAIPLYGGYCATKFAIEAMSEAMKYELTPFGVYVNVLRPGIISTKFRENKESQRIERVQPDSPYSRQLDNPSPHDLMQHISTAEQVAEVLHNMIENPERKFRWSCGEDSRRWIDARHQLDDDDFASYVTHSGYGAVVD